MLVMLQCQLRKCTSWFLLRSGLAHWCGRMKNFASWMLKVCNSDQLRRKRLKYPSVFGERSKWNTRTHTSSLLLLSTQIWCSLLLPVNLSSTFKSSALPKTQKETRLLILVYGLLSSFHLKDHFGNIYIIHIPLVREQFTRIPWKLNIRNV